MTSSNDRLLHLVQQHEEKKKLYSITREAEKYKHELDLQETPRRDDETAILHAKKIKAKAKHQGQKQLQKRWEEKPMHGRYPSRIREADVDIKLTNQWLKSSGLKSETEGLIIAAQDQALLTRAYQHHIIKDGTDPHCRLCNKSQETIDHIISGCPELAKTEYIHRHNKVATHLHWNICREYNVDTVDKWYEHEPKTVVERDNITILYDMPIHTDRAITANRPDIVIKNKQENKCTLIDVAIPSDKNTSIKVSEKLSKYKDLEIEIARMWQMRTVIIPVVVGALGVIRKGTEKQLREIPGNNNPHEIQKTALLGTAHILRKVLSIK